MPHPQVEENDSSSRGETTQGPLNAKVLKSKTWDPVSNAIKKTPTFPAYLLSLWFVWQNWVIHLMIKAALLILKPKDETSRSWRNEMPMGSTFVMYALLYMLITLQE